MVVLGLRRHKFFLTGMTEALCARLGLFRKIKDKKVFYLCFFYLHLPETNQSGTMFSKTCEYAIRAMIFVAQKSAEGEKTGIKEIAKGIDSPEYFIAKILQDLSRRGLLQSAKGPNGGFYLDSVGKSCSLADVVRAVDGDSLFTGCGLGLKQCSEQLPCPIHFQFKKIRTELSDMLSNAQVGDFAQALDNSLAFLRR
ncbi:hypothetical protein GCM10023091_39860 [Ravibacter arvi]|uniref:BadM/Rrf2 family transcriptional regulator n=2 Tax=Ravibacter arvi TaxID=2051041 RepID=A0ABP8MAA1_9BACT